MKYNDIVKSHPTVLVDFYADWCGPCKMMAPIFKELKSVMGEKVKIVKINTEKNQQLSGKMNIKSIPTMILYKNGKIVWQQPGAMPMKVLQNKIESFG